MKTIGIDEVGRGAWAGPLVVGAVCLEKEIKGVTDSKKLSRIKRKTLYKNIIKHVDFIGFGWASNDEIDKYGLIAAMNIAIRRSLSKLTFEAKIIIDGNINYLPNHPHSKAVIKADSLFQSVSAASIVAKEARDQYMSKQSDIFPEYFFEKNVGYGTRDHINAINKYGVCKIHRRSYKPVMEVVNG